MIWVKVNYPSLGGLVLTVQLICSAREEQVEINHAPFCTRTRKELDLSLHPKNPHFSGVGTFICRSKLCHPYIVALYLREAIPVRCYSGKFNIF